MRALRFIQLWNEGAVREALAQAAPDYSYTGAVNGGPLDREAQIALMETVLGRR